PRQYRAGRAGACTTDRPERSCASPPDPSRPSRVWTTLTPSTRWEPRISPLSNGAFEDSMHTCGRSDTSPASDSNGVKSSLRCQDLAQFALRENGRVQHDLAGARGATAAAYWSRSAGETPPPRPRAPFRCGAGPGTVILRQNAGSTAERGRGGFSVGRRFDASRCRGLASNTINC